jgi:molecular chaperone DnaK
MVKENREKIAADDLKTVEGAIEDARKAIGEGGVARLRAATENLEKSLHKIAEVLYKASEAANAQANAAGAGAGGETHGGPAGAASGPQGKKPEDVIDAEYVDVDDKKAPN